MGTLFLSQVIIFPYIIPLVVEDKLFIVCINLLLPMGWVESPKFFCALLETLTGVANDIFNKFLTVPRYVTISKILNIGPVPPHTLESLTHIDCYMDDFITSVQIGS